jgi:hypothetical protein
MSIKRAAVCIQNGGSAPIGPLTTTDLWTEARAAAEDYLDQYQPGAEEAAERSEMDLYWDVDE